MILSCPECRTRYVVPDSAVGATGRQVRCAACRHSWFQDGAVLDLTAEPNAGAAVAPSAPLPDPPVMPAPQPQPTVVAAVDDDFDAFAHEPPFRPRRNPARRWTLAALAVGLLLVGVIGALQWFGTPSIVPRTLARFGLPGGEIDVPLLLEVPRKPERRELPSGNELFALSGRIVNPTGQQQAVPDILAELRDAGGRVVYSWTISPPQRTIAANGRMAFDSAEIDVPKGSKNLNLSFVGTSAGGATN
ncbi:MAG: zinc-ribbon domain-containing protein [Sphingomonadaceae bacterium]